MDLFQWKRFYGYFPLIRKSNEIADYFAERGVDKEAIKGIQENTNAMRKQLTRAYSFINIPKRPNSGRFYISIIFWIIYLF